METKLPQTSINDKEQEQKPKRGKFGRLGDILTIIILITAFGTVASKFILPDYDIRDDRLVIFMHEGLFVPSVDLLMGGYHVRFDDIADIELRPYSARQLANMTSGLRVPARTSGRHRIYTAHGYYGRFRLHVSRLDDASPTIWVTRHANYPVLISFARGYRTRELYANLTAAWRAWQTDRGGL